MRLSDITAEQGLDVIADILVPIANIAEDKDVQKIFKRENAKIGEDAMHFVIRRLKLNVPKLIKAHKEDLICILAAVNLMTVEEYKHSKNAFAMVKDVYALLSDEELLTLFTSAETEKTEESSGSASVNMAETI